MSNCFSAHESESVAEDTLATAEIKAFAVELRNAQPDLRRQRRRDIDRLDRAGMLEPGHALAPEQDRHPTVIIPRAAMRRDILMQAVRHGVDAGLEQYDQVAGTLRIERRT